jgi:hypothetical protein
LAGIVGLGECCYNAIGCAGKLGDHSNPAERASAAEVALASRSRVWFAVIWGLDRSHRLCKVLAHLDMLVENMIPRHLLQPGEMSLGIANLGDDVVLSDSSKAVT